MEYIFLAVESLFSELFSMWVLLAIVLMLIGLFLIVAMTYMRLFGIRVPGKVVGAINQTRVKKKMRDGKEVEKVKHTLYPVFQYTMPNGEVVTTLSSEGGTGTLSYVTGQDVNLIVSPAKDYHDVYDASRHGAFILGLVLIASGLGIIYMVGQLYTAFGMGLISLGVAVILLVYRIISDKKDKFKVRDSLRKQHKEFDPLEVKPVESFKTS